MLPRLTPLASSLEVLDLSGNKIGGTITDGIAVFSKLKKLDMSKMGLDGKPLSIQSERLNGSYSLCNFVHRRAARRDYSPESQRSYSTWR